MPWPDARFWEEAEDGLILCTLCPRACRIGEGKHGICLIRKNVHGVLKASAYGEITSLSMDPIEKKPLYHFKPGRHILSVGTNGCNLRCQFCQNAQISMKETPREKITIDKLVDFASKNDSVGIAYTYNEPFIWYEFVADTAARFREEGLANVFVTNGQVNEEPLKEIVTLIDAANVDLKGFTDEFYDWVGGSLPHTLRTIETMVDRGVSVELTNLVIPNRNDNEADFTRMCDWIRELSPSIPLHISRYFPAHKVAEPITPSDTLMRFHDIASVRLDHVYLGNFNAAGLASTRCTACGGVIVERSGYDVKTTLTEEGTCGHCGAPTSITV